MTREGKGAWGGGRQHQAVSGVAGFSWKSRLAPFPFWIVEEGATIVYTLPGRRQP
jgi:hypothetical protein